tara:strand:+ start:349 stop:492 length:144 start_codon:yes stop_codon:yes gene_type:complete
MRLIPTGQAYEYQEFHLFAQAFAHVLKIGVHVFAQRFKYLILFDILV